MSLSHLIDAAVQCGKCGAQGLGSCDCWERCSCGWWPEKGQPCGNPETRACSSKVKYGTYNRSTRRWGLPARPQAGPQPKQTRRRASRTRCPDTPPLALEGDRQP